MRRWGFSLLLGIVYLAIFHLWMFVGRPWIMMSALTATLVLSLVFARAREKGYFFNGWDQFFHAAVILDILLEGLLIPVHEHYGFYLCALAFAAVLGGYRFYLLKQGKRLPDGDRRHSRFSP